ncbi:glycosyltransferase family 2 protein [Rhizobium lentis]|uniref:glycosyltransferase family 2 protein n=1 Tax=Rhizobium lentis TaxID=1138194 RepID=UPI001C8396A3|nr:glycosyltransferase family 2 protein [Rhizobium lentis]MBX4956157.1 glycosyltransferase [Rhizobium lentis]MBX4985854.1 glycosyltransferase [Rhizobium lentis]MBX5004298.1 glycosyltransferase [Rhizobium lentis]MBX5028752.1 glycosyltransferase [Rhizobium lentis]MBX5034749.1 glycosyltransferase [Rhizobium lentis]
MQRVDIVIPCYNYAHFLQECVGSVLSQAGVDVRVLILDDCSPDNTPEVGKALASRDNRVTYRRQMENRGHIATYNAGIEWAGGDLFLLLSADDYLLPGALGRCAELMRNHPQVGFTFGNALIAEPNGAIAKRVDPLGDKSVPPVQVLSGPQFIRLSGANNLVPTPTAVVRTTLQKQVGGYHKELPHTGDMEMWLRLASYAAVGYINEDQAVYRRHASNMSLQYYGQSILPDLRQRKQAFDILFGQGADSLRKDEKLRRFLSRDLAKEALRLAGMAFNNFDVGTAAAIQRFALEVSPEVRNSLPWIKLACKQTIGPKYWYALNSMRRVAG